MHDISVTYTNIYRELISRKLHITFSFVIQRITWKNCLEIISWKISFRLHEIMFSESISQSFLAGVYVSGFAAMPCDQKLRTGLPSTELRIGKSGKYHF